MDKMTLGAVLLLIGIAILMQSLFADGIGIGDNTSFGHNQAGGTVVGAVLTVSGIFLMIKAK